VVGCSRVKIPRVEALEGRGSHPGIAMGAYIDLRVRWRRASNVGSSGSAGMSRSDDAGGHDEDNNNSDDEGVGKV
jgi:hypothetical protein